MAKIIKTVAEDGTATYTEEATTFTDNVVNIVTAPLDAFKAGDSNEFVDRKAMGWTVLGALIGGMELGDRFSMSPGRLINGM